MCVCVPRRKLVLCVTAPVSFLKARQCCVFVCKRLSVQVCVVCLFMRLLQASSVFLSPPKQRLLKPSPHTQLRLHT